MSGSVAEGLRVLVTGATGFIGRRLVRRLVADLGPDSVICLVKQPVTTLEAEALESYRSMGLGLIEGDLLNEPVAANPSPRVDVVFHLAANIDTGATEGQARVNDVGTQHLLDWLQPASRGARIVYSSSVAVHDRDRQPTAPISEGSALVPRTVYGRTKLRGEDILRACAGRDGYSWTILRLPTVYGPGQKRDGLFEKMHRMVSSGSLLGRIDWPGRTSIVYVDDAVDVMIDLGTSAETAGQTYCVASDESLTVGDLARKIAQSLGKPVTQIAIPPALVSLVRLVVWNRWLQRAAPPFARVPFWRLSLIVSDGFYFDTAKLRSVYRKPLRTLEEALAEKTRHA